MSSPAAGQGEPAGPGSDGAGRPGGWLAFALFLLVSLALQAASFGDTNRHADETFYFLVGQRMHEGLLPYVDVWDRKPFGLFLAYYLIAGISTSVLAYQLVACVLAALAALLVCLLAGHLSNRRGGLYAGLVYLLKRSLFGRIDKLDESMKEISEISGENFSYTVLEDKKLQFSKQSLNFLKLQENDLTDDDF